jgi:hypothetical protein
MHGLFIFAPWTIFAVFAIARAFDRFDADSDVDSSLSDTAGHHPHLLHSSTPLSSSVCSWHTMVETFATDGTDHALDESVLLG